MTITQCKTRFAELIARFDEFFRQPAGTYQEDTDQNIAYGFEDAVKNRMNIRGCEWREEAYYDKGDIITRNNEIYVSRRFFNKGYDPATQDFYWQRKTSVYVSDATSIKAFGYISGGVLQYSKNIASISFSSGRLNITFTNGFTNANYSIIVGSYSKGPTYELMTSRIYSKTYLTCTIDFQKDWGIGGSYDTNDIYFYVCGYQ